MPEISKKYVLPINATVKRTKTGKLFLSDARMDFFSFSRKTRRLVTKMGASHSKKTVFEQIVFFNRKFYLKILNRLKLV